MVSHGLVAGGLFLMVGMIYERCHTRELAAYGGLAKLLPVYSVFFMMLTLASIGLPTTSGFTGEFLVLLGAFSAAWPQYRAGRRAIRWCSAATPSPASCWARSTCCGSRSASCSARPRRRTSRSPISTLREKAILGADRRRGVRARPLSRTSRCSKTELAALQYQQLVAARVGRGRARPRRRARRSRMAAAPQRAERAMSWQTILTAMLPEHLLLAGIVAAARRSRSRRHGRAARIRCRCWPSPRAAAAAVAACCSRRLRRGAVPGPVLGRPDGAARQGGRARARAAGAAASRATSSAERAFPHPAAVVALRRLPAAVRRQLPDAVPRARADVAAGVRAGAARVPAAARAPRRR